MNQRSDLPASTLLAVDSGSPTVSVAVARGERLVSRAVEQARSSESLLRLIDETLAEAGVAAGELGGAVALQGPGSFTGLRVGLATLLGIHQATGVAATAIPTLEVLAAAATARSGTVIAAVDALRGEWVAQPFSSGEEHRPLAPARRLPTTDLATLGPGTVVGFGVSALECAGGGLTVEEAPPLAPVAARLCQLRPPSWDAAALTNPIYYRPPAVTPPRRR